MKTKDFDSFIKRLKEEIVNPKKYQCACCCDNEEIIDRLVEEFKEGKKQKMRNKEFVIYSEGYFEGYRKGLEDMDKKQDKTNSLLVWILLALLFGFACGYLQHLWFGKLI